MFLLKKKIVFRISRLKMPAILPTPAAAGIEVNCCKKACCRILVFEISVVVFGLLSMTNILDGDSALGGHVS